MNSRRAAIAAATMASVGIVAAGVIASGVNAVSDPPPPASTSAPSTTGRNPTRQILGDATLRHRTGIMTDQLAWASTYNAEYVTLSQLQVDAFLTINEDLASGLDDLVPNESINSPHDGASGRGPRE